MSNSNKFGAWLHRQKDSSTSFFLEKALRKAFERYGQIQDFSIDSRQKQARLDVLLKGEKESLVLSVQRYELGADASGGHVIIKEATASREWIHALIQDHLLGRRLPIPEKYAGLAKLVI